MLIGLLRSSKLWKLPSMFSQALIIMTCILLFNSCTLIPSSQPFNLFILKSDINRQYWFGLAWICTSACIGSKKPNTLYPFFCRTSVNRLHKSSSSSTITMDFNVWLGLLFSSLTVDSHQTHHKWYTSNTWFIIAYKVLKLIILLRDFKILNVYLIKIIFFIFRLTINILRSHYNYCQFCSRSFNQTFDCDVFRFSKVFVGVIDLSKTVGF